MVDFVVAATGILHHPAYPDIKGLDSFNGEMWHTAQWNHDVDLRGKRVGVIGTGSTACQVISEISKLDCDLTVFQRTPQWLISVPDKHYSEQDKTALKGKQRKLAALSRRYAFIMRKLTPGYSVDCKRLIISSTFYDAIQRDNVYLETMAIQSIAERGVVTVDSAIKELDVIILATGFSPFNFMRPMDLRGRNGVSIDETWAKKAQAYRSLCIPGFPNFFLMLGPNSPIGNYSVIAMSEVQSAYILKLIELWKQGELPAVEATQEAKESYNAYLRAGMSKTAWVGGCQSWYLDADGDPAMWPYSWDQWVKEHQTPVLDDFVHEAPAELEPLRPAA